jgi:transcriptional regulator with XRE-family HTH domain
MSASDLARLADVTPTAVWNWENRDVVPRKETLARIATVLHVTREWLLNGKEGRAEASIMTAPLDLSSFPLEDLIGAIDRKGFKVNVTPKVI